jgi:hypothetical protein
VTVIGFSAFGVIRAGKHKAGTPVPELAPWDFQREEVMKCFSRITLRSIHDLNISLG